MPQLRALLNVPSYILLTIEKKMHQEINKKAAAKNKTDYYTCLPNQKRCQQNDSANECSCNKDGMGRERQTIPYTL